LNLFESDNSLELKLIAKMKEAFKDPVLQREVLDDFWYKFNQETGIPEAGFCFAAIEVLYRLTGGKDEWFIRRLSDAEWDNGAHYWLERKYNGEIVDITKEQFTERGIEIPYHLGKPRGLFIISNKAKRLAEYIGESLV